MKISVIIPVFNAEKYLKRSIESVINQSYQNWELILVDDGSKDHSWEIINEYSKKDNRIKGVYQENKGPGLARNLGISEATGDYLVFLDSDDYIDDKYFELLVPIAVENDVVFIDVLQVNEEGKILKEEKMSKYSKLERDRIIRSQLTGKIPWGGVRKAVKKTLVDNYNIRYTEEKNGEEALFSFLILLYGDKIGFLSEKPVYMYVNRSNSQSKLQIIDPWGKTVERIKIYCINNNLYPKYATTINAFLITAIIISIDRIVQMYEGKEKNDLIKNKQREFFSKFDSKYKVDKKSMTVKARIFLPFFRIGWFYPLCVASKFKALLLKR